MCIPDVGAIMIEQDGDVPFEVIDIQGGEIIGITPAGTEVHVSIESEPHELDGTDL